MVRSIFPWLAPYSLAFLFHNASRKEHRMEKLAMAGRKGGSDCLDNAGGPGSHNIQKALEETSGAHLPHIGNTLGQLV